LTKDSPVTRAFIEGLRLVLSSEGCPGEANFTSSSGVKASVTDKPKQAATTQTVQEEPQKQALTIPLLGNLLIRPSTAQEAQLVQKRILLVLDLFLGRVGSMTQLVQQKKPTSRREEVYVET